MTQYCTLVVSDEAEKWPLDKKLVLIDGWCAFNNELFILKNNSEIDFSCLLSKEDKYSKDQRHFNARAVESRILKKLIIILNDHHKVNYSERCWKILLGHWLRRYVEVAYNRHFNIQSAFNKFNIDKVVLIRYNPSYLISKNSRDAKTLFSDPYWNSCLYSNIIYKYYNFKNVRYSFIEYSKSTILKKRIKKPIRKFLSFIYKYLSSIGIYFRRNTDPFYINTYLSKWFEIKLFLLNKVFPVAWRPPELQSSIFVDFKTRQDLAKKILEGEISTDIDSFIFSSIFECIPKIYVEDFRATLKKTRDYNLWPKYPKYIFTSNNFDFDDFFKFWLIQKINNSVPYIVGQHGNNYGTSRYMNPSIEEETADYFITWGGWGIAPKYKSCCIFKESGRILKYNKNGFLLLIQNCASERDSLFENYFSYIKYLENIYVIINKISELSNKNIYLRMHPNYLIKNFNEHDLILNNKNIYKTDYGGVALRELIRGSRLVVHGYDSTGILETLSQNIPTTAFLFEGLDAIRDEALKDYLMLIEVGIFHLTPQSISDHINSVFDNIDDWWLDERVQQARIFFCTKYARYVNNPDVCLNQIFSRM